MSFEILHVRNLPFSLDQENASHALYDLFAPFGEIIQIRLGVAKDTRGTAFVVLKKNEMVQVGKQNKNTVTGAKKAIEQLSGYNFQGRHLILTLYNSDTIQTRSN